MMVCMSKILGLQRRRARGANDHSCILVREVYAPEPFSVHFIRAPSQLASCEYHWHHSN